MDFQPQTFKSVTDYGAWIKRVSGFRLTFSIIPNTNTSKTVPAVFIRAASPYLASSHA